MATSLTLEQTTINSKNITRSVTNISPTANDSQLYEFADALNGLTTNTLDKVNRIDKREIKSPDEKISRTLTANKTTLERDEVTDLTFTYTGDGTLSLINNNHPEQTVIQITSNTTARAWVAALADDNTVTFQISETDTYKAATVSTYIYGGPI